ncbi:DUF1131 family protein [Phenylobacterium montanum]|uniref:DUF1131 family protein n=1 Tax=Phenylobacterium montanum TaxID=2823693 RepID=A0A975FWI2_9CAUL|nr:DUF1131 family protein [Caulobacter sp. S6]QUD86436.1 DUF1131 family protein [Caulobacter sp. S6]
MTPRFAALAFLMLVAGCAPRHVEAPAPPATPYEGGVLTAEPWGVGPIRWDTYFESPRIKELFPKAIVQDGEVQISEDETRSVITVSQDGAQMLEIVDGFGNFPGTDDPKIGTVRLVGGAVRGPHGEHIGMGWKDAHFDLSQCELGADRDRDAMVCARPNEGAVTFVFAIPGWKSMEFPPDSLLRAKGFLRAIVWKPIKPLKAKG